MGSDFSAKQLDLQHCCQKKASVGTRVIIGLSFSPPISGVEYTARFGRWSRWFSAEPKPRPLLHACSWQVVKPKKMPKWRTFNSLYTKFDFFSTIIWVGGVKKFLGERKRFFTRKCFRKICSGKTSSNTVLPAEEIFGSKNSWRQSGNFGSLDEAYVPSTVLDNAYCCCRYDVSCCTYTRPVFSAVPTHASSHTNVAPKALTNVRGRTAVLAGMMIAFFCLQSGLVA